MKKTTVWIMVLTLLLGLLSGCGTTAQPAPTETAPAAPTTQAPPQETTQAPTESQTQEFTDDVGRTVTLPAQITAIAISGPLSQVYILPLAGDMLVGVSNVYAKEQEKFLPDYLTQKTEIGQLYGGKATLNLEGLLAADPDVVIDIGQPKKGMKEDLDGLTAQTGIPFVHVDATVATAAQAYRTLGKLLGRVDRAEEIARWCENTYSRIEAIMEKVDADNARKTILYCLGDKGTNVMAEGSFHGETVDMMAKNIASLDEVSSSGNGNEVDMEQLLLWNPEVLVFAPESCYDTVATDPQWSQMQAVANKQYYKTPYGPYGWLSSPPAVQRYLGMLWLGAVLYPDYIDYDLQTEVTEYYKMFYGCELTDEMYQDLMKDAL